MDQFLWKKSILIEVVNKDTRSVTEAFTLAIPPTSYSFQQGQRITRTKTFSGVWEDDYGIDNATITITGDSGNTEIKTVYRGSLPNKFMNGMDALYYLRDNIMQYKRKMERFTYYHYTNYELILYDLSSVPSWGVNGWRSPSSAQADAFIVSLDGQSKINRSSNRPLWASYTLNFFVLKQLGDYRSPRFNLLRDLEWLQNVANALLAIVEVISNALAWTRSAMEALQEAVEWVGKLKQAIDKFSSDAKGIVDAATTMYQQVFEIAQFPADIAEATKDAVSYAMNEVGKEVADTPKKVETLGESHEEVEEELIINKREAELIASAIASFGKSNAAKSNISGQVPEGAEAAYDSGMIENLVDSTGQSGVEIAGTQAPTKNVTIYGDVPVVVSDGMSIESIAEEYMGNASMAGFLQLYSGKSNYDLEVGTKIRVPILQPFEKLRDNYVFAYDDDDTFYGRDIRLGAGNEFIVASSGDYVTEGGPNNLMQALTMRLNEVIGGRLRLTTYGIKAQVGSTMGDGAPLAYIVASIKDTLYQEPRVQDILNLQITGGGDVLNISFTVLTLTGEQIEYAGAV